MKLILISVLITFAASNAFSQISSQKIYTIKKNSLWTLGDNNRGDTTDVTDSSFTVKLDAATMGGDSIIIYTVKTIAGVKDTITGMGAGTEIKISKNIPVTLSFILGKIGQKVTTDKKPKDSILFKKNNNDTTWKNILRDSLVAEINKLGKTATFRFLKAIPAGDSIITKTKPDTTKIKEVSVVFLQRAEVKTTQQKQNEETLTLLKQILSGSGNRQAIGWFTLKKPTVNVYKYNAIYKANVPIKIVRIEVANGAITKKGISVQLNHEDSLLFRNQQSPVTVYGLRKRDGEKLYVENDTAKLHIKLGELFYYNYKKRFHYPDSDSASLSPSQMVDSIYNYTDFNDIIDVTVYTDLLALVGRKPNGILQTQLSGHFITNTRGAIHNLDLLPFTFIQPYFRLSKFDSRFAQVDSTTINNDTVYNKLFLSQVSYLQAGIKLNFMRFGIGPNQELLLNGGVDVNLTSADSLFKKDISFVNYYPEIAYRINGMENFGLDLSVKWIYQAYAKNSPFVNKKSIWIFSPQVTAYYAPFNNRNAKIYLRYANFAEINAGKYNFGQFQFGLKTNLFKKD